MNNNKIVPILIAVIVLLLMGFGIVIGVFLGSGRNKKNGDAQSVPVASVPVTETETTVTEAVTAETTISEVSATEKETSTETQTEPAATKQNITQSIDYHTDHRSGAGSDFVFDTTGEGTGGQVATQSDPLNLRAKPDANAEVIAKMPRGCDVGIFGSNNDWYYLHYTENGVSYYGYASRKYVRNLRYEDRIDTAQSNNSQSVDYHSDHRSGAGSDFSFAGSNGYGGTVATESGSLNLRARPDANAEIITQMPKGANVGIFGSNNDWYYVQYSANGTTYYGYASKQYISTSSI